MYIAIAPVRRSKGDDRAARRIDVVVVCHAGPSGAGSRRRAPDWLTLQVTRWADSDGYDFDDDFTAVSTAGCKDVDGDDPIITSPP